MTNPKIPSAYFRHSNLFITTEVSKTVLVLEAGLEPARSYPTDFKSVASAYSTTRGYWPS